MTQESILLLTYPHPQPTFPSNGQEIRLRLVFSTALNPFSEFSDFQKHRQAFIPGSPSSLSDPETNKVELTKHAFQIDESFKTLFPTLLSKDMPLLQVKINNGEGGQQLVNAKPYRVAVVLSGGQAAGGHNVIMGIFDMLKKMNPESRIFGFLMGPHGVYSNNYIEIDHEYMQLYRNMGGFDMICSGRHKIETPDQFEASLKNCTDLDLDGLVVIGGDDSNTNACLLAEYFEKNQSKCKVVGCPKTIDGDLKNEHIEVSFGFDTATKTYSEAIGNLCVDAMSGKGYYYFIRLMGRSASHIALECALQTRVNWVLIGEEVERQKKTLSQITKELADIICLRADNGKNYGVVLVPEGLIEFIPEVKKLITEINEILSKPFQKDIRDHVTHHLSWESRALFQFLPKAISDQLLLDRDPHGNVQVSKIDTERLLILLLRDELDTRKYDDLYKGNFYPQAHFFGYEGRCALPSTFDSQYCYSLGLNAAVLIREGATGYMSCIKNLKDRDPKNWIAAGCPLPTMMHLERRKGKDVPVIKKALVDLEGQKYLSYVAVREKWAALDCYRSPGPIQFSGANSDAVNFLVDPPVVEVIVKETEEHEKWEKARQQINVFHREETALSTLSLARTKDIAPIPDTLESNNFALVAIKKYKAYTQLVKAKIAEQFPTLKHYSHGSYFVEAQDKLMLSNNCYYFDTPDVQQLNKEFHSHKSPEKTIKIGVIYLGRQAPGGNNVVDGLLRYQKARKNVELIGIVNGLAGLMEGETVIITEESFKNFRNLGGYDYLGRSHDFLRTEEQQTQAAKICQEKDFTGLVMIGATHTLTDACSLSEYFLKHNVTTRVIAVPATVDGNIRHNYVSTSIGFDTASKVYSQLIGNMLTDSASAIKYWYFIRLMGRDPSHLVLEAAMQTHPNVVIISEECSQRGETLIDIVKRISDVIANRANQGKNYGCVLIPEGLLNHVAAYKNLIDEINKLFSENISRQEAKVLSQKLYDHEETVKEHLTPWSYSLYSTLPDFLKRQLLFEREIEGTTKISQIETEKLIAYYVDQELSRRKKQGGYKGAFAPVTHYFGYQGRCSHPSLFDCSLASTYGFTAGILIENNLTGLCTTVQQITGPASQWRVGGVPLLSMVRSQPKSGFKRSDLVVPSEEVDLNGEIYQRMKAVERDWRYIDHYSNPGPIQFFDHGKDQIDLTIDSIFKNKTKISEEIKALCNSIQNDCLFVEHEHLLVAALSSLQSAKSVINSMTQHAQLGAQFFDK